VSDRALHLSNTKKLFTDEKSSYMYVGEIKEKNRKVKGRIKGLHSYFV